MDNLEQTNRIVRITLAVFISFLLIGGCASPKLEKQDPFFDEWKTKAETSKGYSPAKPKPRSEQPQIIKPKATQKDIKLDEIAEKPLPTRKISLKMTDINVSVVLRALARASVLPANTPWRFPPWFSIRRKMDPASPVWGWHSLRSAKQKLKPPQCLALACWFVQDYP